jgi:hypothetical protein
MGRVAGLWTRDSTQNWHRAAKRWARLMSDVFAAKTSALSATSSTLSGQQAQEGRAPYSKSGHK